MIYLQICNFMRLSDTIHYTSNYTGKYGLQAIKISSRFRPKLGFLPFARFYDLVTEFKI